MKTLILAAIRCSLMFTAVAAFSLAYPASVQAVPTTYQYTGNHFTFATGAYTTSDFVTIIMTMGNPLRANRPLSPAHSFRFTFFDGVQTIIYSPPDQWATFKIATDATGAITEWDITAVSFVTEGSISSFNVFGSGAIDIGASDLFGGAGSHNSGTRVSGYPSPGCRTRGLPYH